MSVSAVQPDLDPRRIIGRYRGEQPGPTLLCVAGLHGNEPAGIEAMRRLLDTLEERRPACRGEIIGVLGNLQALDRSERFLDRDLNRIWRADDIERIRSSAFKTDLEHEDLEMHELIVLLDAVVEDRRGQVYFLDLHTTSASTAPFAVINDTLPARHFASAFPVPIILGIEEYVLGTITDHAYEIGFVTVGFEAGRHDDPVSIEHHLAALWIAACDAGVLDPADAPELEPSRRLLAEATAGVPRFLEIIDRHVVTENDEFEMLPGFENFQPVPAGEILARDHDAPVEAHAKARIFMPLYQDKGDDGFFLTKPVNGNWLKLSTLLRRMRLAGLVHWLPGISQHPARAHAVVVNVRIARWYTKDLFHLLGYRRHAVDGEIVIFARRKNDVWQR